MMDLPAPLVPPEVDLRDFPYLPVDIARLFNSEFHALSCDAAWRAGFTLWLKSYHQVPAASIPDDDVSLTRLAELGRDVAAWTAIKAEALRGWVRCSDGRLYHPVVAEKALEAWIEKLTLRKASGAGNAKRYGGTFDPASFDASIAESMALLAGLNPNSRMLAKRATRASHRRDPDPTPGNVPPASRPDSHPSPTGSENSSHRESRRDPDPTPGSFPVGSQEKGSEGNIGFSLRSKRAGAGTAGPDAFDRWWEGYPHKVGKDAARKAFDRVMRDRRATLDELVAGVEAYLRAKPPDRQWCNPATWLNQGRWADQPAEPLPLLGGQGARFTSVLGGPGPRPTSGAPSAMAGILAVANRR